MEATMSSAISAAEGGVITILIAEDDDGHAELVRAQLLEAGIRNPYHRFKDGLELWGFLDAKGRGGGAFLVLLDIRMPRMDGAEVLRRIKADEALSRIPVIMLTTTDDPREIEECYLLGCNCYVTKPIAFEAFAETLYRLGLFIMIMRVSEVPEGTCR
jgi:CheY-like chemotaxis protein